MSLPTLTFGRTNNRPQILIQAPSPGNSELLWRYGVLALLTQNRSPALDEVAEHLALDYQAKWAEAGRSQDGG
jgi:hypothetical protein